MIYDLLFVLVAIVAVFLLILNIVMIVRFFQMSNDLRDLRNHFIAVEKEGVVAETKNTVEASSTEKPSLIKRIISSLRVSTSTIIFCVVATICTLVLITLVYALF